MEALRIIAGIVVIPGLLCAITAFLYKDLLYFWFFAFGSVLLICIALGWI